MNQMPALTLLEPTVSVIVPCYNSERTIRSCLHSLLAQSTDNAFEIIVVDSSTDSTPDIVRLEFPSVKLIHLEERTFAGAARNIGAQQTSAALCLMIDSDCIARDDLIDRALARARSGQYAVIGGSLRNGTPRSLSGWTAYLIEFKEFIPTAPMRLVTSVPTANALYSRDALEQAGYFDKDMWLAEDVLLNWRIHAAGGRHRSHPPQQDRLERSALLSGELR
jgi:glycosyltransferase involved in cell wall biosynthesis